MKRLLLSLGLLLCASSAWGACHAVGPAATGTLHDGSDFNNLMAMPASNGWVRGDTYYLVAGVYPNKLQFGPTVSGTTVVHIWRATNADHGAGCTPSIAAGYVDATMGQPGGPANLKLFEGLTSYLDLDGKYHPTPWQTAGGGLNVQTGYGFYINGNTACGPGACWELNVSNGLGNSNYTMKNIGIYGRGDANTEANCPSCNQDTFVRFVGGGGTHVFQYIGMFNSSSGCVQAWNTDNWSFDHIWCEHIHATGAYHTEAFSMSGGSHNKITNSILKDVEGTGAFVQLSVNNVGQTADDYEIAGNVIFVQPGNPTGRTGYGNGVISCINNDAWTNLKFVNNTIAFLPGQSGTYFLTGSGNCSSQTGLIFKDNLYYSNAYPNSASQAATPLTGYDYNTYIATQNSGDTGSNTISVGSGNPFVSASPLVGSDFFLASNTNVTPWLSICGIAPDACPDGVGTTRAASRGAFEKTGATASLSITPSPVAFGNVNVGSTGSVTATVSNVGSTSATLSNPYFTITPSVFTNANSGLGGQCANGTVLAAAANCTVLVRFTPVSNVLSSGTLNVNGTVSTSVSLSGTGTNAISIPSVPTNLAAVVNGTTVNLTWTASTGTPTAYNVLRGTVSGGPYTQVAAVTSTSYADLNRPNGSYFYVVTASNSAGTSANSNQAAAVVANVAAATFSPSSYAFGNVVLGGTANSTATITNTGTAALILNGSNAVVISGANAADFASNGSTTCTNGLSVAVGGSCVISITFTPSTTTTENATVCLVSNSANSPDCAVMAGTGTVAVSASPTSLNFGNIYRNKVSSPQTVTFTNSSGGTVTFSSISVATGDNTQFIKGTDTCGGSVANGATCTVAVTFQPTSVGSKASALVFTFTGATGSPISIALSGRSNGHKVLKVGAVVGYKEKHGTNCCRKRTRI